MLLGVKEKREMSQLAMLREDETIIILITIFTAASFRALPTITASERKKTEKMERKLLQRAIRIAHSLGDILIFFLFDDSTKIDFFFHSFDRESGLEVEIVVG